MISKKVLEFANDGYGLLLKISDFVLINMSLLLIIQTKQSDVTAVDIMAGFSFSVIFLLIGEYSQLYSFYIMRRVRASLWRLIITLGLAIVVMKGVRVAFHSIDGITISHLSPIVFDIWYVVTFAALIAMRYLSIFSIRFYRKSTHKKTRIAILGMTTMGLDIERGLLTEMHLNDVELSYYDDRGEERFGYLTRTPYEGGFAGLLEKARNGEMDEVYIALPLEAKDRIRHYLAELSDTTVNTYLVPDLHTYNLTVSKVKPVNGVQTLSVFSTPFDGTGAIVKRIEDIIIGSIITLLISPILLAVAIGVKLSSPGPVLFKQNRYGLGGKKIQVWKFRSMKVMENSDVVKQATKNDPRVTRFGAFIRRTSLDELPQFFNVLQGSMSIVGPRPHAVAHNEEYRVLVDNYMIRHKIKPGITGWAQINGYRGETETLDKMEKRIQYDIKYLQHWTLWLDIKIIFLTIFKGFVSETAY